MKKHYEEPVFDFIQIHMENIMNASDPETEIDNDYIWFDEDGNPISH